MSTEIATLLAALITGISSMVTAYILGYSPRKTKEEIKRLQKELLDVYSGVYNLKAVEEINSTNYGTIWIWK